MSGLMISEYMDIEDGTDNPLTQLRKELDEMNIPLSLNYENSDLMSSEFFDTAVSMEHFADNETSSATDTDYSVGDANDLTLHSNDLPEVLSPETIVTNFDDLIIFNNNVEKCENQNNVRKQTLTTINPKHKKIIVTKPNVIKRNKNVFKVSSLSGKGKPLTLTLNATKDKGRNIISSQFKNLKMIKIIDAVPKTTEYGQVSTLKICDDDSLLVSVHSDEEHQYPMLILTDEEKRLLLKEGLSLPTHYPLTKPEEQILKRIRRKIRNKRSAQDSRKRKKEYLDQLEERIKEDAKKKEYLMSKINTLQTENNKLTARMNKLQDIIFRINGSKATPTTCLLIILVSLMLISVPNMNLSSRFDCSAEQQSTMRRALLSSNQASNEDSRNLEDVAVYQTDTFDINEDVYVDDKIDCNTSSIVENFLDDPDLLQKSETCATNLKNTLNDANDLYDNSDIILDGKHSGLKDAYKIDIQDVPDINFLTTSDTLDMGTVRKKMKLSVETIDKKGNRFDDENEYD